MPTIKDVAEKAGVSTATVSHVINGTKKLSSATTDKVMQAIQETGYIPNFLASSLRSRHSLSIGVLVEDSRGLPVPEIVSGIAETLSQNGYRMLLYDLHLLEKLYNRYEQITAYRENINVGIGLLLAANVDGIIYVGMHDRHLDDMFDSRGKPLVFAYSHGNSQESFVTYSNLESAKNITNYLIALGHRKIAVICGHPHSYPTQKRLNGFQLACQEAGLTVPAEYIRYGNWEYESGLRETQALLALPDPPTAIFAMNDLMAAGCIHALSAASLKVPEDMSLVGFDNREISRYLLPPLTTIALPTTEIGTEAAAKIIKQIKDPTLPILNKVIPCKIIERESARAIGENRDIG